MTIKVKRGELSIRETFIESLKNVLKNENYVVYEELIVQKSSGGNVKIPDIVILEKGKFREIEENDEIFLQLELNAVKTIIETKHPSKIASEGLLQLFEYCDILNVYNGFTTNFSNIIFYYQEEKPIFIHKKKTGKLKNRCNSLSKLILSYLKEPPSRTKIDEISEDSLIETLQTINDELKTYIKKIEIDDIRDSMGIFEISSDKEIISDITDDDIKNAASFLLLNQLLFYGILSEKMPLVTFIEKVQLKEELEDIFKYIYFINYRAVYGYNILQYLDDDCINAINSILAVFKKFNFHELKSDILGKIFHGIIPLNLRKRIAAYYTSNTAGELLARLSIFNENDKILDPACGSGTLLVSALHVKEELLSKKRIKKNHQDKLEDIFGIDISVFAAHLSVINLSIQDLTSVTNKVYIFIDDAFNVMPTKSRIVLFAASPKHQASKDGVKEAEKVEIPLFNVIISNPPFTRIERLTEDKKEFLQKQKNMKEYMFGQAGLHVAFIIHSFNFLVDGGYLAMVLPSATFSSNYSEKIEQFLLNNFKIIYYITSEKEIAFSEDANFKEILLICKKEVSEKWTAKFITFKKVLRETNLKILSDKIINSSEEYEDKSLKIRIVSKAELSSKRNWMTFIREDLEEIISKIFTSDKLRDQNKIIKFHEGYHLDAPYFFRIPNNIWNIIEDEEMYIQIQNKEMEELRIPKSYLIKSLGRPQDHHTIAPEMSSYILNIENNARNRRLPKSDLKKYIEWGETYVKETMSPKKKEIKTVLDLYKIKKYMKANRPWYTYGNYILRHRKATGVTGQIGGKIALIEKFGLRTRCNIAFYSKEKLTGSNSFFFGELIADGSNLKVLASWFCSSFYLLLYLFNRREIGGDYGRIKIRDFASFKCIDTNTLSNAQKKTIIKAFNTYERNFNRDIDLHSQIINRNKFLKNLDMAILSSLELNIEKSNEDFLEEIYTVIIDELTKFET